MTAQSLPIESFVRLAKPELQGLLDALVAAGYRTIGPRLKEGAIVWDDLRHVGELPTGWTDLQQGGSYRLVEGGGQEHFGYSAGPDSLKRFLFPPREDVLECRREGEQWRFETPRWSAPPLAAIGLRACDLRALAIQDRVFLDGHYVDDAYQRRRLGLFVLAVNCSRAAATCFCHSMGCGPGVSGGFDVALTELEDWFILEIGTERGGQIAAAGNWAPCSMAQIDAAREVTRKLRDELQQRRPGPGPDGVPQGRQLDLVGLRELLLNNLEHPRWEQAAERCLACGNCTMVCPTCFCSTVQEVSDLRGDNVVRQRGWSSCFTSEHSYMNSGAVRKSTASRYRQWLTHKLATWHDQFGESGCVGCGRCIAWCPVGIDLTEEVAALRESAP
jgi:ferredoxin